MSPTSQLTSPSVAGPSVSQPPSSLGSGPNSASGSASQEARLWLRAESRRLVTLEFWTGLLVWSLALGLLWWSRD
jgi:hypothetical protein